MSDPLDLTGVGHKISRAQHHLDHLRSILSGEHDAELRPEFNAGEQGYDIYREGTLDLGFGILVGELVHNARSALDHVVTALLTRDGKEVKRHNNFPIYATKAGFLKNVWSRDPKLTPGALDGLSVKDRETIRDLQPYIGRDQKAA